MININDLAHIEFLINSKQVLLMIELLLEQKTALLIN